MISSAPKGPTSSHHHSGGQASTNWGAGVTTPSISAWKTAQILLTVTVFYYIPLNIFHHKMPWFAICTFVYKCFKRRYDFSGLLIWTSSYRFTWTKDDKPFDFSDPRIIVSNNSGTFKIPNEGHISHFQGKYRCFASNKLGVAMSEEIEFIVPSKYDNGDYILQMFPSSVK